MGTIPIPQLGLTEAQKSCRKQHVKRGDCDEAWYRPLLGGNEGPATPGPGTGGLSTRVRPRGQSGPWPRLLNMSQTFGNRLSSV